METIHYIISIIKYLDQHIKYLFCSNYVIHNDSNVGCIMPPNIIQSNVFHLMLLSVLNIEWFSKWFNFSQSKKISWSWWNQNWMKLITIITICEMPIHHHPWSQLSKLGTCNNEKSSVKQENISNNSNFKVSDTKIQNSSDLLHWNLSTKPIIQ